MVEVGRVAALWRYPVKSMAGEALSEAEVGWNGLAGDRRWAFVRAGTERSGFPWLTLRERPELRGYRPSFADPEHPDRSPTLVETPSGRVLDVVDPALCAELGDGVRVLKHDRGLFDTFPLSLLGTGTVEALAATVGVTLDPRRFRPNLLVEAGPGAEDDWIGATLRIGTARIRVDRPDGRCVVVNLDPATGASDPRVLRAIARDRAGRLGVYGSTVEPGRIAVEDLVLREP